MPFRLPLGAVALAIFAVALLSVSGNAQTTQGAGNPGPMQSGDTQQAGSEPPPPVAGRTGDMTPHAPIGSGPETTPSKFDENVAARDRIPIMARPLALTDEQKRRIYDSVMNDTQIPVTQTTAEPAMILPHFIELSELPAGMGDEIPVVRGYKSVKLQDKVLLVSPPNRIVVGEIRR
jgi:hypothetical protein